MGKTTECDKCGESIFDSGRALHRTSPMGENFVGVCSKCEPQTPDKFNVAQIIEEYNLTKTKP